MGLSARAIIAAAAAPSVVAALACGDALIFFGDPPGILRIAAGLPDTPGSALDSLATDSQLNGPRGVVGDPDGTVFIADHVNERILAVAPTGRVQPILAAGDPGAAGFGRPDGLATDGADGLWIADPVAHRVWRLDLPTRSLGVVAGSGSRGASADGVDALQANLDVPTGVLLLPDGRLAFSELANARVRAIEADGTLSTIAGTGAGGFSGDGGPAAAAQVSGPAGLAVHGSDLYIADSGNHRVRAVDLATGLIRTIAGNGNATFSGDGGLATAASMRRPLDVAITSDGRTLFIADNLNHRVRVVDLPSLTIGTFAGTGDETFNGDGLEAGASALSRPGGLTIAAGELLYLSDMGHHLVRRTSVRAFVLP